MAQDPDWEPILVRCDRVLAAAMRLNNELHRENVMLRAQIDQRLARIESLVMAGAVPLAPAQVPDPDTPVARMVKPPPPPLVPVGKKRRPMRGYPERACEQCGAMFPPMVPHQVYCGPRCRETAQAAGHTHVMPVRYADRTCDVCGKAFRPNSGVQRYCCYGCACKVANQRSIEHKRARKLELVNGTYGQN